MYKIHYKNKVIWLVSNEHLNDIKSRSNSAQVLDFRNANLNSLNDLDNLRSDCIIFDNDLDLLKNHFFALFNEVFAAGGVVYNPDRLVCMIFRNGFWDLPKGKIEKEESPEEAAVREVEEETGLSEVKIIKPLPNTYHTYEHKGRYWLKTVYWYDMSCHGRMDFSPQKEEGITDVVWKNRNDIEALLINSFPSIRDTLNASKGRS
ncbi:MAG: NUDIX domain-containing protein [Bacteroidia bacterium]|nr:NUDIX domain-containing protein [Bacteroidia bacterium]